MSVKRLKKYFWGVLSLGFKKINMKKLLLAMGCVAFLVGCGAGDVSVQIPKPMGEGNDGRIQQYLEENIMESGKAVCSFDWLNQPNGNVVEVWALCEEFELAKLGTEVMRKAGVSLPVKITFANPSLHVVPADGSEYMNSIEANFSEVAVEKIKNEERDIASLEERNLERSKKWLLGE